MLKNIYLICGKSGSGKTTLVDKLSELYGYKVLRSYTTRKPRYKNDKDHYYVSISDYYNDKTDGLIIADTCYKNNLYWSRKEQLEMSDLYVIDKKGIEKLFENYHGNRKCVVIYIDVDQKECMKRMRMRGDTSKSIRERIDNDEEAFKDVEELSDFIIDGNKDKNAVLNTIYQIISDCERVI